MLLAVVVVRLRWSSSCSSFSSAAHLFASDSIDSASNCRWNLNVTATTTTTAYSYEFVLNVNRSTNANLNYHLFADESAHEYPKSYNNNGSRWLGRRCCNSDRRHVPHNTTDACKLHNKRPEMVNNNRRSINNRGINNALERMVIIVN